MTCVAITLKAIWLTKVHLHHMLKDIILTFYFCKLLRENGYRNIPTGFQFRGGIKLAKNVPIGQQQLGIDTLSFDQAVYARWLMAKNGFSNHEFKWNTHVLFVNKISAWISENPFDNKY